MAKVKIQKVRTSTAKIKNAFKFFYTEKFFNKFLNKIP